MPNRRLTLRREALVELSRREIASLPGAASGLGCFSLPDCYSLLFCTNGPCASDFKECETGNCS